ncbi:MAG: serine protease, partial [Bacteroidota bacterium]
IYNSTVQLYGSMSPDPSDWSRIGSGFLYTHASQTYLITADHVIRGQQQVKYSITSRTGPTYQTHESPILPLERLIRQPQRDIAIWNITSNILPGSKAFLEGETLNKQAMEAANINIGSDIAFLGFPGILKNKTLRTGTIAEIQDFFEGNSSQFVLDASVSPGFSGGPVLAQDNDRFKLIGMVTDSLYLSKQAIGRWVELTIQEFPRLTTAVSFDAISQIIETPPSSGNMKLTPTSAASASPPLQSADVSLTAPSDRIFD